MKRISEPESRFAKLDGLRLHYWHWPGERRGLVLLHGLTANGRSFDGLMAAGLAGRHETLAVDLRGRGRSDHPDSGYSIQHLTDDLEGLLDAVGLSEAVLVGHSYGGYVALHAAARLGARVPRLVLIDVPGPTIRNPAVDQLLLISMKRLERTWPSWDAYLEEMKRAPFLPKPWDPVFESQLREDVRVGRDGLVRTRTRPEAIEETLRLGLQLDWPEIFRQIRQPVLFIHAGDPFGGPDDPPLVSRAQAVEAAALLADCRLETVPGNHVTVLLGSGALRVADWVARFLGSPPPLEPGGRGD